MNQEDKSNNQQFQTNQEELTIKVYIRINITKKGFDFECRKLISSSELIKKCQQIVARNNLIESDQITDAFTNQSKYVLIHCGSKLFESQQIINLDPSNILYVVNKEQVQKPLINLKVRFVNKNRQVTGLHRFTQIVSHSIIGLALSDLIALNFNRFIEEVNFVHLGKILQTMNYFCEQYIQDQSQITCIDKLKSPETTCLQRQPTPLIKEKKKLIVKQQSIQLMGITEQPYKPTISFNQIQNSLKKTEQYDSWQEEQIIIGNHKVKNAQAMELQLEEAINLQQHICCKRDQNMQMQLQANNEDQNQNDQKQEIKTKQQIQNQGQNQENI